MTIPGRFLDTQVGDRLLTSALDGSTLGNITLAAAIFSDAPTTPGGNVSLGNGTAQGNATALAAGINYVTGANDSKASILPAAINKAVVIVNTVQNKALPVYAPTGNGTINGGSANANVTLGNGTIGIGYSLDGKNFFVGTLGVAS